MARIVSAVASTHNPRICWNREQADPQDFAALETNFATVRRLVAQSAPDVIMTIANDHLDSFFFDNMPSFAVGTGAEVEGPFWYEAEIMHLPAYRAAVRQDFAQHVLRAGVEAGLGFSQVNEFRIDHAVTLPMSYIRPEADLPLVPIITNAFGYPLPGNRRWYELGQFLRRAIEAWPGGERVCVLASFSLTVEVGGPKAGQYNMEFTRGMLAQMKAGQRDAMLESLTVPRLIAEGNSTAEFLNYVALLGVVEDQPPSFIENQSVKGVGMCPVAFWDLAQ